MFCNLSKAYEVWVQLTQVKAMIRFKKNSDTQSNVESWPVKNIFAFGPNEYKAIISFQTTQPNIRTGSDTLCSFTGIWMALIHS